MRKMKIVLLGGGGFIGTNLAIHLIEQGNRLTIYEQSEEYFTTLKSLSLPNTIFRVGSFNIDTDFDAQVKGHDIVYHLVSTIIPGNSNKSIINELEANIIVTAKLLDACVRQKVKQVVFISSGGAVYGRNVTCPIKEEEQTNPISSYGLEKLTIEKLLYLYHYQYGLDYRVIRLANPYGPYQRPNGRLGVVTTFIYKAITNQVLEVFGDGSIVRDFIYIDDAVKAINNIVMHTSDERLFNVGSGRGTSVNNVIDYIKKSVNKDLQVEYIASRVTDVPINYLDISKYENMYGKLVNVNFSEGIRKTAKFLEDNYKEYEK